MRTMNRKHQILLIALTIIAVIVIVFSIIFSILISGTGTIIITNSGLFNKDTSSGIRPPIDSTVNGVYFDEYARKIQTLDLDKLRQDNPSKETAPGMYTGSRNIAEEFEIYLLLSEICQRPEINPVYSGSTVTNPSDSWIITPGMLYGIWYHESGMSMREYSLGGDNARAYHMWDSTSNGQYGGPCGQNLIFHNRRIAGNARMWMYISRFEAPDMPDELRAIGGSESEIKNDQGVLYDGTRVTWAQISQYVKFNEDIRPSPKFVADSLYSEARAIRQIMSGQNQFVLNSLPNGNFADDANNLAQWINRFGIGEAVASQLGFLWAVSPLSAYVKMTNPPDFTNGSSSTGSDGEAGLYRLYLAMAECGVPLDFWATKDSVWCPPSSIGDSTRDMSTIMQNINEILLGVNIRTGNSSTSIRGKDAIIHKLDGKSSTFPNLVDGFQEAYQKLEYEYHNAATQSPFPIEALNGGNWIQSSVWKMVDVYYDDERYTVKSDPADKDSFLVEPGQVVSGNPSESAYADYVAACPKVVVGNAIKSTGNKWYVTRGLFHNVMDGPSKEGGFDYHAAGTCTHAYGHKTYGHPGLDIHGTSENNNVYSVADGVIVHKRYFDHTDMSQGFGTFIVVMHCVNGNYFCTVYAHLQPVSYSMHEVGDVVKSGEVIGLMGATGASAGGHVHFQFNYNFGTSSSTSYGYSISSTWNPEWSLTVPGSPA